MKAKYLVIEGHGQTASDAFERLAETIEDLSIDGISFEYIGSVSLTQISHNEFIAYHAVIETINHG